VPVAIDFFNQLRLGQDRCPSAKAFCLKRACSVQGSEKVVVNELLCGLRVLVVG
jgi:hypothetical protein